MYQMVQSAESVTGFFFFVNNLAVLVLVKIHTLNKLVQIGSCC